MDKAILVTRPNHDLITTYLFKWSEYVINVADKKGIKVLDLSSKKANETTLTSYIVKNEPILVFLNGHGNKDVITGYDNKPLISANKNEKLLEGKIVYARSCDAAKNLGQLCIKNNTLAFIGYQRKYAIGYSQSSITNPLRDEVAKLFITPSNLVPISLLKGNSVRESYRKSQDSMARNFSFMLSTRASPAQRDSAPYLWANRKYQVVLGDENTKM
ncbi:MAG: hypothetical protein NUV69_00190 [Candidatus Curtissbacteria bacterium]|nr:hypothetical protein [Candidatus Curtissbacteria bacterium]